MAEFKAGDRVRIVEHNDDTREPKPGGKVREGTVTAVNGLYAVAKYEDHWGGGKVTASFYRESGWAAWDGEFRWRLLPVTGEEGN